MKGKQSSEVQSRKSSSFYNKPQTLLQKDTQKYPHKSSNLIVFSKTSSKQQQFKPSENKSQQPKAQFFKQVNLIQSIINRKLELKRQRKKQLQLQIEKQTQQKIHLYNINQSLQIQLRNIKEYKQTTVTETSQETHLKNQIAQLQIIARQKQRNNKQLMKQTQMLQNTLKSMTKCRKQYVNSEVRKKPKNIINNKYLKQLICQLNKIKQIVQSKIAFVPAKKAFK